MSFITFRGSFCRFPNSRSFSIKLNDREIHGNAVFLVRVSGIAAVLHGDRVIQIIVNASTCFWMTFAGRILAVA